MYTPYTYLIKHLPTNQYYYGAKYAVNADPEEFFKTYFTSSRKVAELIASGSVSDFSFEIRKTFKTRIECCDWEHKVLRRLRVGKNPIFLNMHDNYSPPVMFGDDNPSKRPAVQKKLSIAAKNRPNPTQETLDKIALTKKNKTIKKYTAMVDYINNSMYDADDSVLLDTCNKVLRGGKKFVNLSKIEYAYICELKEKYKAAELMTRGKKISAAKQKQHKIWINDGETNISHPELDLIPNGFVRGFIKAGDKWKQGHACTDETKAKLSVAHMNKTLSEEHIANLSKSHKGLRWKLNTKTNKREYYRPEED